MTGNAPNERVDPFAELGAPPIFTTKPRQSKVPAKETIDRLAQDNNFPSREASKPRRKQRQYRTGRDRQLNLKATTETIARFHKAADERAIPLGRLLELALDALEGAGGSAKS